MVNCYKGIHLSLILEIKEMMFCLKYFNENILLKKYEVEYKASSKSDNFPYNQC